MSNDNNNSKLGKAEQFVFDDCKERINRSWNAQINFFQFFITINLAYFGAIFIGKIENNTIVILSILLFIINLSIWLIYIRERYAKDPEINQMKIIMKRNSAYYKIASKWYLFHPDNKKDYSDPFHGITHYVTNSLYIIFTTYPLIKVGLIYKNYLLTLFNFIIYSCISIYIFIILFISFIMILLIWYYSKERPYIKYSTNIIKHNKILFGDNNNKKIPLIKILYTFIIIAFFIFYLYLSQNFNIISKAKFINNDTFQVIVQSTWRKKLKNSSPEKKQIDAFKNAIRIVKNETEKQYNSYLKNNDIEISSKIKKEIKNYIKEGYYYNISYNKDNNCSITFRFYKKNLKKDIKRKIKK